MKVQKLIYLFLLIPLLHLSCNRVSVTDTCNKADSLYVQGIEYERVAEVEKAVVCYRKGIAILESEKCDIQLHSQVELQLADLLLMHTYYDRASHIYRKALSLAQEGDNPYLSSRSYRGIGKCMIFTDSPDSALYYVEQALSIVNDIDNTNEVTAVYNNLSAVYCDLGDYDKAIYYNDLSLLAGADSTTMGKNIANQAYLYLLTEQYDSAHYYAQICYDNFSNEYTQISALETLYSVAAHYESKDTAYYTSAYTAITNQLTTNSKTAAIADAELKLSEEFLQQQLDSNQSSHWILFGFVVLSVVGWLIVLPLARRRKSAVLDVASINSEEDENDVCAIVRRGEEYAKLFKESVAYNNMVDILDSRGYLPQPNQQEFFEAVSRNFAPFIEKVAKLSPQLTNEQFQMCCLALMGLTNQQCAACRNVGENAIRTQKSRIKSKMLQSIGDTELFDAIFSMK